VTETASVVRRDFDAERYAGSPGSSGAGLLAVASGDGKNGRGKRARVTQRLGSPTAAIAGAAGVARLILLQTSPLTDSHVGQHVGALVSARVRVCDDVAFGADRQPHDLAKGWHGWGSPPMKPN
jgi:hypothetical protein